MLRPVTFQSLDETLPLLTRGFPAVRPARWAAGLRRLKLFGARSPATRTGYVLEQKRQDIGVILTIPSVRPDAGTSSHPIVNLSSWYIEPEHRWRAPRMLQSATQCNRTLYTDLSATPRVQAMIGRLGFRNWTEGTLLCPLPLFALRSCRECHVVAFRNLAGDSFPPPVQQMLSDHVALDCVAGGLWDGLALQPLIFSRKTYRGVPIARLIYAGDRSVVLANLPAIARFLLREGFLLLAICADQRERVTGSIFMSRSPTFYKGPFAPAAYDLAYSEFVFLQI